MDLHISHVSFKERAFPSSKLLNSENNTEALRKFSVDRKWEPNGQIINCCRSGMIEVMKSFWICSSLVLSLPFLCSTVTKYEVKSQSFALHNQSPQGLRCLFSGHSPHREVPGSTFLIPRSVSNVCCIHVKYHVPLLLSVILENGLHLSAKKWKSFCHLVSSMGLSTLSLPSLDTSEIPISGISVTTNYSSHRDWKCPLRSSQCSMLCSLVK